MPKPYPQEFRDDVVRVAQAREEGVTLEQIAADFGIHPMTPEEVDSKGRRGGRYQAWHDRRGVPGAARGQAPRSAVGAGERDPSPSCCVPVPGEPAGKRWYPLV